MAKSTCSVPECERVAESRGWCGPHYKRWWRHGDPLGKYRMHGAESEFAVFRDIMGDPPDTDECWEWAGSINEAIGGYGEFGFGGRMRRAHVVAFRLYVRELLPGEVVRHGCDNPPCCNPNPKHLLAGTQSQNMADKVERNRQAKGEDFSSSKLTEAAVRAIRAAWGAGGVTQRELAERHGVSRPAISMVVNRHTWTHVV